MLGGCLLETENKRICQTSGIYKDRLREEVHLQEVVAMSVLTVFILTDLELLVVIMASKPDKHSP